MLTNFKILSSIYRSLWNISMWLFLLFFYVIISMEYSYATWSGDTNNWIIFVKHKFNHVSPTLQSFDFFSIVKSK